MIRLWSRLHAAWGLALAGALLALAARGASADCAPVKAGLDTSLWNTAVGTSRGKALGQSFLALDTLITRITVWRPPNDIDAVGTHLFVTTYDTVRAQPVTQGILQDGPTVFVRGSDTPGPLIEMSFVLDPPLALPRPGIYAFFLQREGCDEGETWLIESNQNPYPHGMLWVTGITSFLPCHLRRVDFGRDYADLIFQIEYCRPDAATPVKHPSWGHLKVIYR